MVREKYNKNVHCRGYDRQDCAALLRFIGSLRVSPTPYFRGTHPGRRGNPLYVWSLPRLFYFLPYLFAFQYMLTHFPILPPYAPHSSICTAAPCCITRSYHQREQVPAQDSDVRPAVLLDVIHH